MSRKGKSFKQSVSIGITKCFAVSTVTTRVQMLSHGVDTVSQSFWHSFIAQSMTTLFKVSQSRNLLFKCVKSLVLSWKPHSWFQANSKTFYCNQRRIE